jgi:hypothetical protein
MTPETVDIVTSIIEQVADMLAPGAQAVWTIAMAQVKVLATQAAVRSVVFGIPTIILLLAALKNLYRGLGPGDYIERDGHFFNAFLAGIFAPITGVIAYFSLESAIGYWLNPAYYAIQLLLTTAGVK